MNDSPQEYQPAKPPPLNYGSFLVPAKPRVWSVFLLFFSAFVAAIAASSIVLVLVVIIQHGTEGFQDPELLLKVGLSPIGSNLSMIALESVLLIGALGAAIVSPIPYRKRLRLNSSGTSIFGYLIIVLGMLSVSTIIDSAVSLSGIDPGSALKMIQEIIANAQGPYLIVTMLVMGIGAGFGEEFLCRGYVQTRLSRRWGRWPAIIIASILFGLLHLNLMHSSLAFLMGLYLGYITERTGSIWPAVVCHMINNMANVCLTSILPEEVSTQVTWVLLATSAILGTLSIWYINSAVHPPKDIHQ